MSLRLCLADTELTLGRVLGRGGFCVVSEVTKIALKKQDDQTNSTRKSDDEHFIHNLVQDRAFMAGHYIRQGKDCRYAIKKVQDSCRKEPQIFINAVVDLAVEARFLAVIRHPVSYLDRRGARCVLPPHMWVLLAEYHQNESHGGTPRFSLRLFHRLR